MSLDISHYPLLAQANTPDELRQLPQERLTDLCAAAAVTWRLA